MLKEINNGRNVHEVGNLRQTIQHCLTLMDDGYDTSDWCKKNLVELADRAKALYRQWLEVKRATRGGSDDRGS